MSNIVAHIVSISSSGEIDAASRYARSVIHGTTRIAGHSPACARFHITTRKRKNLMADLPVTVVLPSGGARTAEVPDDVPVRELLAELISQLKLPTLGPDGRTMEI